MFTKNFKEKQAKCHKFKKDLEKRATKSELKFQKLIKDLGYRALFQKGFIKDYFCIVDFYIPSLKLVVEIDGGYHLTQEQINKDRKKDEYLTKVRNFKILRLTNDQVEDLSVDSLRAILVANGLIN
jgi:very-short-patch-repair endonuclease